VLKIGEIFVALSRFSRILHKHRFSPTSDFVLDLGTCSVKEIRDTGKSPYFEQISFEMNFENVGKFAVVK